jgi:hypothetical protein
VAKRGGITFMSRLLCINTSLNLPNTLKAAAARRLGGYSLSAQLLNRNSNGCQSFPTQVIVG